jgi:hypothetical protein
MKKITFILGLVLLGVTVSAQQITLKEYLPQTIRYNQNIPTPQSVIGYQVGEWSVSHDKLVSYMKAIAAASNRAVLQVYAHSYEHRPLIHLIFSSPENLARLDEIKKQHRLLSDPLKSGNLNTANMPLVVLLGYTIHGNEPSGANASLLTAYYLAAAQGAEIDSLLQNTVIVVDPTLNPDGMNRFAEWINTHKSVSGVTDPNSQVFNEAWPRGRSNHYWFDLNRDYIPLVHPESRGRVNFIQEWLPNIVTDHHEQGSDATFFFQPGVPSRNNPVTPKENYVLTAKIANYHAKMLDQIGSLYFTEERYDDYYVGKGSSYPDINGGIGILFEQASVRGFQRATANGVIDFPFAIKNQFTVTLSTLRAAMDMRKELLNYQRWFYRSAYKKADKDPIKGWVFGDAEDKARTNQLLQVLKIHHIDVYKLSKQYRKDGQVFNPETSFVIPFKQKNYRLLKSIFEPVNHFTDSTFYDVSTWNLWMAFDMPNHLIKDGKTLKNLMANRFSGELSGGSFEKGIHPVAWGFRWEPYYAPRALACLQEAGIRTKLAMEPFTYADRHGERKFGEGSILIPATQKIPQENIIAALKKVAKEDGVDVIAFEAALTPQGIDLGSRSMLTLKAPKIMMLVEGGVSSIDAGEIWHLLDFRFHKPVSLVKQQMFSRVNLYNYNTIILPGGSYNLLNEKDISKLNSWISDGGLLIVYKSANIWAAKHLNLDLKLKKKPVFKPVGIPAYVKQRKKANEQAISGAIFMVQFDPTHPLAFGLEGREIPVFKSSALVADVPKDPYAAPFRYVQSPLLSGYASPENQKRMAGAPFVIVHKIGKGTVISFMDNTNFRGFWYATNKIFANAVFFGKVL